MAHPRVRTPRFGARFGCLTFRGHAAVEGRLQTAAPIAGEAPAQRLTRWRLVFASELADLDQAVMAASSHGGAPTVSDIDRRSAIYLAGWLLATLYGIAIDQVTP